MFSSIYSISVSPKGGTMVLPHLSVLLPYTLILKVYAEKRCFKILIENCWPYIMYY